MRKLHVLAFVSIGLLLGWASILAVLLLMRDGDPEDATARASDPTATATLPASTAAASPSATAEASPSATTSPSATPVTQLPTALLNPPASNGAVYATVETEPLPTQDDTATDVAIWQHPDDPAQSLVIVTDRLGGKIVTYGMDGRMVQELETNNVAGLDLRDGFEFASGAATLVLASDQSFNTIAAYRLDADSRELESVEVTLMAERFGFQPGGLCLYRSRETGALFAFVSQDGGTRVRQWQVTPAGDGVSLRPVRDLNLGSEARGCVADEATARVYVGEASQAIWRYAAEPGAGSQRERVDTTGDGGNLEAEIEGLALYRTGNSDGYLIASNEGSDTFTVYDRTTNAYLGSFRVMNGTIDRTSETTGIEVTSLDLGPLFPRGVFIAQDDQNNSENQNFKLVPWQDVAAAFTPALKVASN